MSRIKGTLRLRSGAVVERWLDPRTGLVFTDALSDQFTAKSFELQSEGVWKSHPYVFRALPVMFKSQPLPGDGILIGTLIGPSTGMKYDGGKPRPTLLHRGCHNALSGVIDVLTFGAAKYAADSWQQVEGGKDRYRDALYRHLSAIESGEVNDPESGLPHWHHVCCNALFLAELNHKG